MTYSPAMDEVAGALRDEWETTRVIADRTERDTNRVANLLSDLYAKRRADRRPLHPGSARYEWRKP